MMRGVLLRDILVFKQDGATCDFWSHVTHPLGGFLSLGLPQLDRRSVCYPLALYATVVAVSMQASVHLSCAYSLNRTAEH